MVSTRCIFGLLIFLGSCLHEIDTSLADINLHSFEPYIDAAIEAYPTIQAIGFGLPGIELEGKILLRIIQR